MTESAHAPTELPPASRRVHAALQQHGIDAQVLEFPQGTRTAQDAANAVGCEVGQIVKSIIFRAQDGRGVLVLTSGANRVDEAKLLVLLGQPVGKADADFVRETTGFAIGGVPPLAHAQPMLTLIDEDLLQHAYLWAAAGTPSTVFKLSPQDLLRLAPDGKVGAVKK